MNAIVKANDKQENLLHLQKIHFHRGCHDDRDGPHVRHGQDENQTDGEVGHNSNQEFHNY